ncbi:MAG: Stk1 family PASTA domain-containing Ser/Thr kinase [Roseburia sp.]
MLTEGMYLADRYEIVGKIGAGGMSDVYKAKDHTLGRFVAIKVLKSEFSDDVNFVTKFRTEAQSAAGLEHPNIVNIYDVGSENGMHYIVMEYVEGITLKTYIEKKGQLSFKEAVSIAIQVGRGIEAAHNKHIVHRDIKPQNIMISTEGKVKVMDFGIARAATSNTINSDVMGSVHYSSPEQARNGFVDGKSDIYSLGIVMYEMVTGRVPFDGDTTVAVAIQHLQEEMVVPSAYAPDLPISMEKIILKCTQKNPDRRYESMGDLLVDLKKALISPNEDFVVMVPASNQDKTRVIEKEELDEIKKEASKIFYQDEEDEDADTENEDTDEEDEEDEDGAINPKMEKAITIMGIVAGVVIVALIIYLIVSFFGLAKFGGSKKPETETQTETETETEDGEMVTMIDVTDMTFEEAQKELKELGLGIKKNGTVSSDTIAEGNIAEQDVAEGKKVEVNSTINVKISSGKGEISVPNVVGSEESSAISTLKTSGFKVGTPEYEYNDTVAQGKVIRQTPEAGSAAKEGDTITIVISQGAEVVTVPDVYNKSQDVATSELTSVGLVVSSVSLEYSDTIAEGNVISQSVTAGKMVDKGTSVTLVISRGPKVKLYKFSATINLPKNDDGTVNENVAGANIVLKDSAGNVIPNCTWSNVSAASFPYSVNKTDIEDTTSGTLVITWLDAEGNQIGSPQTESVTFEAQ